MRHHSEPRPRDDKDDAQDLARDLADIAAQLAYLKGEANTWLRDPDYGTLKLGLEGAKEAPQKGQESPQTVEEEPEGAESRSRNQALPRRIHSGGGFGPGYSVADIPLICLLGSRYPRSLGPTPMSIQIHFSALTNNTCRRSLPSGVS
jgi:hypothetical protein